MRDAEVTHPAEQNFKTPFKDAAQYALIKATQDNYGENVSFSQQKTGMFQGGYNTAFDAATGMTTAAQLSVEGGATLIAERLQLQGGAASSASGSEALLTSVHPSDASRTQALNGIEQPTSADFLAGESKADPLPKVSRDLQNGEGAVDSLQAIIERIYRKALMWRRS
jgi:hypothetical protein